MKRKYLSSKKNQFVDLILLLFPHLFTAGAVLFFSIWLYSNVVTTNPYFNLIVIPEEKALPIEYEIQGPEVITPDKNTSDEKIPVIYYESQWATLNIEGWNYRDIPVYFGDSDELLAMGAGHYIGSRFCGQGSKIVICAHVTSHFYEIEDTNVGDIVTMDTIYGTYKYRVKEVRVFSITDESLIKDPVDSETLILYTCYPRVNGFDYKTERIALICEKTEGKDYPLQ